MLCNEESDTMKKTFIIFSILLLMIGNCYAMSLSTDFDDLGGIDYHITGIKKHNGFDMSGIRIISGDKYKGTGVFYKDPDKLQIQWYCQKPYLENSIISIGGADKNLDYNLDSKAGSHLPGFLSLYKIHNSANRPMYLTMGGTAENVMWGHIHLISRNNNGKWFSYFCTADAFKQYGNFGWSRLTKIKVDDDKIVFDFTYDKNVDGKTVYQIRELTYYWDENSNWFGVRCDYLKKIGKDELMKSGCALFSSNGKEQLEELGTVLSTWYPSTVRK